MKRMKEIWRMARPFYDSKYKTVFLSLSTQEEVLPVSLNETSGMHGCVGARRACNPMHNAFGCNGATPCDQIKKEG